MKTIISALNFSILLFAMGCGQAQQNNSSDKQVESMLLEFYTKHAEIWENTSTSIPADILHKKLDSLAGKYCTQKIQKESQKWFEDGQDLLTNDWGINTNDLQSMVIKKDTSKKDTYIVSYITFLDNPGNIPKKKDVTLYIIVVKEGESYKIDSVK